MVDNTLRLQIQRYKQDGFKFQQRRHEDWKENYQLFRNKVITNRLTQRQSVNVPLMKETCKTILAKIDDAPDLTFEERENDEQKDIFLNEYWKQHFIENRLEIKDIIDKKQVFLYGRSYKKLNICDGKTDCEIIDPYDILVDRFVDPADIDTAHCIIHQHIFRTLSEIEANANYDQEEVTRLKLFYATAQGLIKAQENSQSLQEKNQRLQSLGDVEINSPQLGETYVELNEVYLKIFDKTTKSTKIHLVVTADQNNVLYNKPLSDILGKVDINGEDYWSCHYPFVSWSSDVERQDWYSDGEADVIRTPNKIANAWFSQMVENRSLRNFGMRYYDSTNAENFVPTTFIPQPFGWYPVPGNPDQVIKDVNIPDLSESLDELQFVIGMVESSSAATATEKGMQNQNQVTLGEVQLMTAKAEERITSMSKFYRSSWKEYGEKWSALVQSAGDKLKAVTLYKKSYKNNYYAAELEPTELKSEAGYGVVVKIKGEAEKEQMDTLQKLNALDQYFGQNPAFQKVKKEKMLDLLDLTPEQNQEIMSMEEQMQGAVDQQQQMMMEQAGQPDSVDMALQQQTQALNAPQEAPVMA